MLSSPAVLSRCTRNSLSLAVLVSCQSRAHVAGATRGTWGRVQEVTIPEMLGADAQSITLEDLKYGCALVRLRLDECGQGAAAAAPGSHARLPGAAQ